MGGNPIVRDTEEIGYSRIQAHSWYLLEKIAQEKAAHVLATHKLNIIFLCSEYNI